MSEADPKPAETGPSTLEQAIEAASSRAALDHANDSLPGRENRPLAYFIGRAVREVVSAGKAFVVGTPPTIKASCAACGKEGVLEGPFAGSFAPQRCGCGGMLIVEPAAQTTERRPS